MVAVLSNMGATDGNTQKSAVSTTALRFLDQRKCIEAESAKLDFPYDPCSPSSAEPLVDHPPKRFSLIGLLFDRPRAI
jgi:hypothetical protein